MGNIQQLWHGALRELNSIKTVGILSHIRPDGDAYGSMIALGLALEKLGKTVHLWNEDALVERYSFLPGVDRVQRTPETQPTVDALISVDNAAATRLGKRFSAWKAPVWLNIDHHISNENFATLNLVDSSVPATAQLLYELMVVAGWEVTPQIAENLFVGISTDTGSFRYRGTTDRTFDVVAALSRSGIDVATISQKCYSSHPLRRLKLMREILNSLDFACGNRIAFYSVSQEMYRKSGACGEDTEGLIEMVISNEGVDLAIFFEERQDGWVKMSFRSKGLVNVNKLASKFGGGGHAEAAGAQIEGTLELARQKVLPEAEQLFI